MPRKKKPIEERINSLENLEGVLGVAVRKTGEEECSLYSVVENETVSVTAATVLTHALNTFIHDSATTAAYKSDRGRVEVAAGPDGLVAAYIQNDKYRQLHQRHVRRCAGLQYEPKNPRKKKSPDEKS